LLNRIESPSISQSEAQQEREWQEFIADPDYDRDRVFFEWKMDRYRYAVDRHADQFQINYETWSKNPTAFFSQGFSIEQFMELRQIAILGNLSVRNKHWGVWFNTVGNSIQAKPFLADLRSRGVVVQADIAEAMRRFGGAGSHYDFESIGLLDEAALDVEIFDKSVKKGKILSMTDALGRMRAIRARGKRVSVALGNFDVGTKGHIKVVNEFVWATHNHGEIFVLVGGDKEVAARKGPERPYVKHQQRMEFVAQQPGVDWVVPVSFPEFQNFAELQENYERLHSDLSGLAHCRLIGDVEATFPSYLAQCNQAGILLVHSNAPRISRATEEGKKS
jgi:hypothetical protein